MVDDEVGCAESVCQLIRNVIPFKIIPGTWTLWDALKHDARFGSVTGEIKRGTIIISPTGTGNGSMRGHVGILSSNLNIMSASSSDGIWKENYTIKSWQARYAKAGGFPMYFFVLV